MDTETLIAEIKKLKKKKDAVILAHNYQPGAIQDIADHVGDSFALSQIAATDKASVIVFCGVHFMAESAKILSPQKQVWLPVMEAGCPMADMVSGEDVRKLKKQHPEAAVVCYVNSSAEVKAESTICCTSSNAVNVVRSLSQKQIIFVPDQNLAQYVAAQVPEKEIIIWEGYCPVHHYVKVEELEELISKHPDATTLIHPECPPSVVGMADFAGSTSQILDHVRHSKKTEFIIGTEEGILHTLQKENPGKQFYIASPSLFCEDMKKISLQDLYLALLEEKYEIETDESIRSRADKALQNMLRII